MLTTGAEPARALDQRDERGRTQWELEVSVVLDHSGKQTEGQKKAGVR